MEVVVQHDIVTGGYLPKLKGFYAIGVTIETVVNMIMC